MARSANKRQQPPVDWRRGRVVLHGGDPTFHAVDRIVEENMS